MNPIFLWYLIFGVVFVAYGKAKLFLRNKDLYERAYGDGVNELLMTIAHILIWPVLVIMAINHLVRTIEK